MIGPRGYWTELSRMVTFARPDELTTSMAASVTDGITEGAAVMAAGVSPGDVQRAVLDGVERHGASTSYWSGHSLGLDVIEDPMIGLDVVEDAKQRQDKAIESNMVITLHPMVQDTEGIASGYMSDTFIVTAEGSRKLSEHPTGLYRIARGEVHVP
jgi:Xaa-Pro aminopeptidase